MTWKKWAALLWLFVLLFIMTNAVFAREILQGDICTIDADTVIDGDVFVICRELVVDGQINGQLIGTAVISAINGRVNGNIYLLSGQLDINTSINGHVHFAGALLDIHSTGDETTIINGELIATSLSITIDHNVTITRGIINLGYQLIINGRVKRDISYWGSAFIVNGYVDGSINATVGDPAAEGSQIETLLLPLPFRKVTLRDPGLVVTENGYIAGQLIYSGPEKGIIADGVLANPAIFEEVLPVPILLEEPESLQIYFSQIMHEFWTLFVIGLVGLLVTPRLMLAPLPNLRLRPISSFSVGMLSFILSFPVMLLALLLSILIIIILALLRLDTLFVVITVFLGVLNIGFVTIFYFVALAISRVMVSILIGHFIIRTIAKRVLRDQRMMFTSMIVGIMALSIAASLPAIGWIFNAITLFLGLGTILMVLSNYLQVVRSSSSHYYASSMQQAAQTGYPQLPAPAPPARTGTENLPEGFDFDFFKDD